MKKLISRNPVQRFKQGRKIVKADLGTVLKALGYAVGLHTPETKNGVQKTPQITGDYVYTTGGRWGRLATQDEIEKSWGSPKDQIISKYLDDVTDTVDDNGNLIKNTKKRPYYQVDPTDGSKYLIGTDGSRTLVSKGNKSNVNNTKVNNKSNSIQQRNPGAYHNITTWQNKLKDFYEPGTFAVDGIWGDNTEAAYQKYLQSTNSQKEAKEIKAPKMPITSSIYNLMNPVEKDLKAPLSAPVVPQTYNRTQVREFLRNKGVNPYSFSGDQRRAVRMVLNGQGTDEDKALVQSMGIFKKGGILPSRNPITRFRNRKFN